MVCKLYADCETAEPLAKKDESVTPVCWRDVEKRGQRSPSCAVKRRETRQGVVLNRDCEGASLTRDQQRDQLRANGVNGIDVASCHFLFLFTERISSP